MLSQLDGFHPVVRTWFERRFGTPSRAQALGWPVIAAAQDDDRIAAGHDVLLCAPTGSGKTLAAFMWAINRLVLDAAAGQLRDEVAVLYVSPLKALANDIRLNLTEPLDGVQAVAREVGLDLAPIRAGLRTGDTPAAERNAMLRRPPQILVTTPESLFILLTSPRFREKLTAVRYVIVDELHAVASDKRGAHLMLTLERLERLVWRHGGVRPARIGLSATLNPINALAAFLAGGEVAADGTRGPRPVQIVRADETVRALDLAVLAPGPELGALATHQHWEAMYDAVARLIEQHRTTLIFTLSRRWAERIALALQKRVGADAVMAHHGSLARAERLLAEQRLKRGELKAIVATASLELGIDVGTVDLVCQIDSPKSISSAVQRIGRSGHRLGATPKGRFFALTLDDLTECAAAVHAIRQGQLDAVETPGVCLDVAAQQIVAIAAEEEDIGVAELLALLRSAHGFADLDLATLERLLGQMATALPERIQGAAPKIFYDRLSRRVRPRRGARLAAITSAGTIPESGNYDVVIQSTGRKIGDVEEDFAQESVRGDIFSLGSMPWRIMGISKSRLMVEPAPGMAPSLPFWQTEAGGRSPALSAAASEIRRRIAALLADDREGATAVAWLVNECALDDAAASQTVAYVRRGIAALGVIPDEKTLVVERFFDGLGGTQIVIHAPLGIRFNRGLGLALRKRLCQSFDFEIQASAIDDAVLLALNSRHSFPLEHLLELVNARTVREVLTQALLDAPMFEVRFRHVATRALSVTRSFNGRRVPAWIQRLRTQELITALFPQRNACFENRPPRIEVPKHFIVAEAVRECLEESADLERIIALMRGLEDGAVRTVMVDSVAPSAFAHRILLAWDYSFLDDGERANRRSRTVSMNRAMAEDVMRHEDLSSLLADEAVAQVAATVGGYAPGSRAHNADELLELIRAHGSLPVDGLAERVNGDAATILAELERELRVVRLRVAPETAWRVIAAEDAALFAAAYADAVLESVSTIRERMDPAAAAEEIDPAAAAEEIVRRALATAVPLTAAELAARVALPLGEIDRILVALETRGTVFQGHFTTVIAAPDDGRQREASLTDSLQWSDRYVLERIHRQTLSRLRAEIEPCADHEYAAFRTRWQHCDAALSADPAGVSEVLAQLAGLAYAPEFWERAILPARISGYRPELLDLVCMGGEFRWTALDEDSALAATSAFPTRVAFVPRHFQPPPAPVELDHPGDGAVRDALVRYGAQYLDQIADHAGMSERDALAALWRLAAHGLASNDSFAALRLLASDAAAPHAITADADRRSFSRHDAALRARLKSSMSGRWSVIADLDPGPGSNRAGGTDPLRATAVTLLLARNGVLTREMLALESTPIAWSELAFTLRRMEYAGTIRRGYFVRALSGEQYALPEALELLRAARTLDATTAPLVAMSAADPANPYGILLPGCGVTREPANLIVMRAGRVILGLAGRALVGGDGLDPDTFTAALTALMRFRPRLAIETIGGEPALASARVGLLAAMRFHSDGRALIYDGLPGPAPARANRQVMINR